MLRFILGLLSGKKDGSEERKILRPLGAPIPNDIICDRFKVKGKYPGTGRMRTTEIIAWDQASDEEILKMAGFVEPYEIERIGLDRPTERQLEYAKNIGLYIPSNASKKDVSILLHRYEDEKPIRQEKAPKDVLEVLIKQFGIYIPTYANEQDMNACFYWSMKDYEEKYAYFAMKVYAQNTGKNYRFIHEANSAEREKFYEFSRKYKDNKSFVESFDRYKPEEFSIAGKIKRKLKAYEMANAFFYENL